MKGILLVVLVIGALLWQSILLASLSRRLESVETKTSILLAGYRTEREHREMVEAWNRGEDKSSR